MADQVIPPVPTPPTPSAAMPVENTTVPAAPVAGPTVMQSPNGNSSKSMMMVILAAFVVVAILVGVGIYMYTQVKEANPAFQQISQSAQESLTSAETDLSGVQEDNLEADFADVDKDLSSL